MKTCGKCGSEKPPGAFNRDRSRPDGLHPYCRECNAARFRERRLRDGVMVRQQDRERHERHKVKRNAASRHYNRQHAERNAERAREWRERNAAYARAEVRLWQSEHAETVATLHAAKRARKRDAVVESVSPLIVLELADGVCGICGEDVDPFNYHVDHIHPLSKGGEHSYENTQPAHPSCNQRKHASVA